MRTSAVVRRITISIGIALLFPWMSVRGQGPQQSAQGIQSLAEPGEALAIRGTSQKTGLVTFASTAGRGILVPLADNAAAQDRALSFIDLYGGRFGIADRTQLALKRADPADSLGFEHVRFQQVHRGIPVTGGEFIVHLKGARVTAANGLVVNDLPTDVTANVDGAGAIEHARQVIAKYRSQDAAGASYSNPRLQIFNRGVLAEGRYPSRLAWFVEATGPSLREFIWIDAHTGALLTNFSQLTEAKNRTVYSANNSDTLPGTLRRAEGQAATGDMDVDNAYDYAGITYDFYLTNFGRNSYDNAGGELRSTVHYKVNYQNAFWNGTQMVYGDSYASADDVVGHELTHAVTERTAGLYYYNQSGALNESFSDIMGETLDLTDNVDGPGGTPRWKMGEDLPIGAIRDMSNPTLFQNPGKMSDSLYFVCSSQAWDDPNADRGGVHTNSGIPNHAYALMVDGGSYNGQTVTGIGLTKASQIEYRALTAYLTEGSGFLDDFNALNQACTDLIGAVGITASDCAQVNKALLAVQMNQVWPCSGGSQAPALCPTGTPNFVFQDGFEAVTGNWSASTVTAPPPAPAVAGSWTAFDDGLAKSGLHMATGTDVDNTSDHRLSMTANVTVPSGGRLYFDHLYEFENSDAFYDGGVLEYSVNSGASWTNAGSLIDAGRTYPGSIVSGAGNPMAGSPAFVGSSYGYTGTRLDLSSLAGQNIRFRFRIGTDAFVGSLGWLVDNFGIYSCGITPPPGPPTITTQPPASTTVLTGQVIFFASAATGSPTPTAQWQVSTNGGASWSNIAGATSPNLSFAAQRYDNGKQYRVVYTNSGGSTASSPAALFVRLRVRSDLDNDRKADLVVWRPSNGYWFWLYSSNNYLVSGSGNKQWGNSSFGDIPLSGDMDGDGRADLVIWRPSDSTWYWLTSSSGYNYTSIVSKQWGSSGLGDVPLLGDIDGDGKSDLIVWRPTNGTWYWLLSSNNYNYANAGSKQWGNSSLGDKPMIGDMDGDGLADLTVWRASDGNWFWLTSTSNYSYSTFGQKQWGNNGLGDIPLIADMDGDGVSDLVVWRASNGTWYWLTAISGYSYALANARQWGNNSLGDIPLLGDIDGDGASDLIVWRNSNGTWFWLKSSTNYSLAGQGQQQWGASGDKPMIK